MMFGATRLAVGVLCPLIGFCASLSAPPQVATPGQTLIAALSFASEAQAVSGLQFDLDWDPALALRLFPGAQIGSSTKVLYAVKLPNQALRVMIVGTNQQLIADGELVRSLISVDPNASAAAQIRITNAIGTDPYGNAVSLQSTPVIVQIQGSAAVQPQPPAAVVNAASLLPGPLSPGEIVTVLGGANLERTSAVLFNGIQAPVLYAGASQVNTIVPFGLDPNAAATLDVRSPDSSLAGDSFPLAAVSPAIFTQASSGVGAGVILNQDYSVNSFSNPARPGSIIILYGTGFGSLVTPVPDGQAADEAVSTATPVTATISGFPADVLYAGAAPGLIAGVVQINVAVPGHIPANPAAPMSLTIGSVTTAPGVTVSIGK